MNLPSWLTTLVNRGVVAHSAANPKILAELITLGIVAIKTAGIRRTVVEAKPEQLRIWLDARYPDHGRIPNAARIREGNILRSGGSKAGSSAHGVLSFQFKWFGKEDDLWTQMTRTYGVAAVLTDRLADLTLSAMWRLLTIENWEPFFRTDYSGAPVPVMVAYLGGNAPGSVMDALKTFPTPPVSVLHFGDYDWEGLYIFQRLQKVLPQARLYIPDNIETLFKQFGKLNLIENQRRKALFDENNMECLPVIKLIEQHNAGLEQEIVGLPGTAHISS
ncbi:MAG: hypothetical protein KJ826_12285 [Proteobacteria bacterium]|nr:hypothetical protein [Pseudomonadota bacterium]